MKLARRGGSGENGKTYTPAETTVLHTFRLREKALLQLTQQFVYTKRTRSVHSWPDFFDYVVDLIARLDPESVRDDAERWPGGRILTKREQQLQISRLALDHPELGLSASFKTALAAVRSAPYGPERARRLEDLLEMLRLGFVGPSVDVAEAQKRSFLGRIRKRKLTEDYASAQWADRGKSRRSMDAFEESLDPAREITYNDTLMAISESDTVGEIGAVPPAEALPEPPRLAGPRMGRPGEPSPDGSEEALLRSVWEGLKSEAGESGVDFRKVIDQKPDRLAVWWGSAMFLDVYRKEFGEDPERGDGR